MDFETLVTKTRSCRRFYEDKPVDRDTLEFLVSLACKTPSAANKQPLKYVICNEKAVNAKIFSTLKWAGYLTDWEGPSEGERPSSYIIMIHDKNISESSRFDEGIACQTIALGATSKGLASCIIASADRTSLKNILSLDNDKYEILLVIAVGHPKEKIVLEDIKDGNVKYYRDENNIHHVPKRTLNEVLIKSLIES